MAHMYFRFHYGFNTIVTNALDKIPAAWQRSLIADYGVPLMVILWTSLSYSLPSRIPSGVPRRLFTPLPWEPKSLQHWTVAKVIRQFVTMTSGSSAFYDFHFLH